MNTPNQFEREGARVLERGNGALAAAITSAASRPVASALCADSTPAGECLTLAQVAARLKCRQADVPLRRPGEAEGIGYFVVGGSSRAAERVASQREATYLASVRIPVAELVDWIWRCSVRPVAAEAK